MVSMLPKYISNSVNAVKNYSTQVAVGGLFAVVMGACSGAEATPSAITTTSPTPRASPTATITPKPMETPTLYATNTITTESTHIPTEMPTHLTEVKENLPNLAFYNPEQLENGVIQVTNNAESPAQAYDVRGDKSSFSVSIRKDGKNELEYAVRKEEGISKNRGVEYPEGSDVLFPGEVSLEKDLRIPWTQEKYKLRLSIDPSCQVNESTRSDNNYELDVEVAEDGTRVIVAHPLELSEFEHCTQKHSWSDYIAKSTTFDEWKENGEVELERIVDIGGKKVNFWIHRGEYDIAVFFEENSVGTQEFLDRVQSLFSETIPYTDMITGTNLPEYNIVITQGKPKNSFSEAYKKTNVIGINAVNWHRGTEEGNGKEYLPLISAAHEDYHLRNYLTDPDESKFGREYSAIIHEAGMLANVFGKERLEDDLSRRTEYIRKNKIDMMDLTRPAVTRVLAYHTAVKILDSKGLHTLENLAEQLLSDSSNGIESFDKVSGKMGLGFTFEDVWNDFQSMINLQ